MEFSTSSWHYKLVERVYGRSYFYLGYDTRKNVSLCKYFWSTVLGCILYSIWIPIKYIIVLPLQKLSKHFPETKYDFNTPKISEKSKDRIGMGFLIGFLCIIAGAAIYGLIVDFWKSLMLIGVVSLMIGVIVGIAVGINMLADLIRKYRHQKIRTKLENEYIREMKPKQKDTFWNMLKEYLKNKKQKVCPFLNFKDEVNGI